MWLLGMLSYLWRVCSLYCTSTLYECVRCVWVMWVCAMCVSYVSACERFYSWCWCGCLVNVCEVWGTMHTICHNPPPPLTTPLSIPPPQPQGPVKNSRAVWRVLLLRTNVKNFLWQNSLENIIKRKKVLNNVLKCVFHCNLSYNVNFKQFHT